MGPWVEDGSERISSRILKGGTKASLLSTTELSLWIQVIYFPFRNVIVIIDACYRRLRPPVRSLDIIDPDYDANFGSSVSSLA
jgi:hypothetical protein